MKKKYLFETDPETGKIIAGTVMLYPDNYNAEGSEEVFRNQERAFLEDGKFVIYDLINIDCPSEVLVDDEFTAIATLPDGTPDTEVIFVVEFDGESYETDPVPVIEGLAEKTFLFDTEGQYMIAAYSLHHGRDSASVTVITSPPAEPADEGDPA